MREAVGGSLLIYLILPIIALFVCFIAFIMNYASAYRAANYIASQYENCQSMVGDCGSISEKTINEYVAKKYYYKGKYEANCYENGTNSKVCRITLPVEFDVPVLGRFKPFNVVVETKTLHVVNK